MPDPNEGWLDQPDPSSPTQTNRDAEIAARTQDDPRRFAPPLPENVAAEYSRRRRRAIVAAVLAVLFLIGAIADAVDGQHTFIAPLVIAGIFAIYAGYVARG